MNKLHNCTKGLQFIVNKNAMIYHAIAEIVFSQSIKRSGNNLLEHVKSLLFGLHRKCNDLSHDHKNYFHEIYQMIGLCKLLIDHKKIMLSHKGPLFEVDNDIEEVTCIWPHLYPKHRAKIGRSDECLKWSCSGDIGKG